MARKRTGRRLPRRFFDQEPTDLARALLGVVLLKDGVGGPIVETEAYHEDEAACHAHRGRTKRNASLFLEPGQFYVYRIHQAICCNVVCGPAGVGAAVLLRALLPTDGRDTISKRRGGKSERNWTDGPGKLCAALEITLENDGLSLLAKDSPIQLVDRGLRYPDDAVQVGPRIGISKAIDLPWRFVVCLGRASPPESRP